MVNRSAGRFCLGVISKFYNNCENELTVATDTILSVMPVSSLGAADVGWVTKVIATLGLNLLANVITI